MHEAPGRSTAGVNIVTSAQCRAKLDRHDIIQLLADANVAFHVAPDSGVVDPLASSPMKLGWNKNFHATEMFGVTVLMFPSGSS